VGRVEGRVIRNVCCSCAARGSRLGGGEMDRRSAGLKGRGFSLPLEFGEGVAQRFLGRGGSLGCREVGVKESSISVPRPGGGVGG